MAHTPNRSRLPSPGDGIPHFIEIQTALYGFVGCRWRDEDDRWVSTVTGAEVEFSPGDEHPWRDTRDADAEHRDLDAEREATRRARRQVERSLYYSGVIEDPDADGGLLG